VILGVGVDVVQVERVRQKMGESFDTPLAKGAFTASELEYAKSKGVAAFQSLAGFFAAKEAFFKATQVWPGWHDVWVKHDENGRPYFGLHLKDTEKLRAKGIDLTKCRVSLTISHEKEYAVAVVVVDTDAFQLFSKIVETPTPETD
jgi:holo-[acyl-carrier protein] synthase